MPRILVTRRIPNSGITMLEDAFGGTNVSVFSEDRPMTRAELHEAAQGVSGILCMLNDPIDAAFFAAAGPQLRIVANYAVGYNNIDLDAAAAHGVAAANTPDVLTESTADLAWAILMATARRLGEAERYLREGQWRGWAPLLFLGVDVYGKTLGVFGMGRIGQAFARRAKGFGMRVLYTNRNRLEAAAERELGAEYVDKAALVRASDFLSLHCPLTDATHHAFGAAEFAAMKPSACLVNTARGPVVDEAALAEALEQGRIFAAGLDVFEEEPKVHPKLLTCPRAVLVPHLGSSTKEARSRMGEVAAANIIARLEGKAPPNWLNPEAGA